MKNLLATAAAVVIGLSTGTALAADDTGLYDPLPPEGSAFVRFLSDFETTGSRPALANGKTFDYLDYKEVSSYFVVPEGTVKAEIGENETSFDAEAGNFYTVVLTGDETLAVKNDPKNDNQAKAQVMLYNLSGHDNISLKTEDGSVEIIPPVADGEVAQIQVNPVKVPLAIYDGTDKLQEIGAVTLDRSRSYSAIVMSENDVEWIQATTNTVR